MSNMRKDIFTDRWVIVADGDAVQPTDFHFKKFARDTKSLPILRSNQAERPRKSSPSEIAHLRLTGRGGQ